MNRINNILIYIFILNIIILFNFSNCNKIEKVIDQYFDSFLDFTEKTQSDDAFVEFSEKYFRKKWIENIQYEELPHEYNCKHDYYDSLDKSSSNLKQKSLKIDRKMKQAKSKKNILDYQEKYLPINNTGKTGSIRFYINDTYLIGTNDITYACYTVGQRIVMGGRKKSSSSMGDCYIENGVAIGGPCWYTCQAKDLQLPEIQNLLRNYVVKATFELFSMIIQVDNQEDLLKLDKDDDDNDYSECSYGVQIPDYLYTEGIKDVDHYIFITSRPTTDASTIAYSLLCDAPVYYYGEFDDRWIYGRPRMSVLNFNPNYFLELVQKQSKWLFNQYVRVGIHEMVHSLGFSSLLYNSYINKTTGMPYPNVYKTVTVYGHTPSGSVYTKPRYLITSKSVNAYAKQFYNCSKVEGFELEDYGSRGTKGSHWEKRVGDEELMTGYISPRLIFSNLTLSLLADTGWYTINFTYAEPILWGKGKGCSWLDDCSSDSWGSQYFCSTPRQLGCTATRFGIGICQIVNFTLPIPLGYQHFASTHQGGINKASDYCPFYSITERESSTKYCINAESVVDDNSFEEVGPRSRCIDYFVDSSEEVIGEDSYHSQSCWNTNCYLEDRILEIEINKKFYNCSDSNHDKYISTSENLVIICPKFDEIC